MTDFIYQKEMMTKKIFIFLFSSGVLFSSFYQAPATAAEKKDLQDKCVLSEDLNENLAQLGKDLLRLRMENEAMHLKNEKLRRRSVRYKEIIAENKELRIRIAKTRKELLNFRTTNNPYYKENAQLTRDLSKVKKLNSQLETKAKENYVNFKELEDARRDKKSLEAAFKNADAERVALKKQNQELFDTLNKAIKNNNIRQSILYSELGAAYVRLKNFDMAVLAYEESLKVNPKNIENYYSLGILYNHVNRDKKKAIKYLKEYLLLNPEALNKKEVQYLIDMISKDR